MNYIIANFHEREIDSFSRTLIMRHFPLFLGHHRYRSQTKRAWKLTMIILLSTKFPGNSNLWSTLMSDEYDERKSINYSNQQKSNWLIVLALPGGICRPGGYKYPITHWLCDNINNSMFWPGVGSHFVEYSLGDGMWTANVVRLSQSYKPIHSTIESAGRRWVRW